MDVISFSNSLQHHGWLMFNRNVTWGLGSCMSSQGIFDENVCLPSLDCEKCQDLQLFYVAFSWEMLCSEKMFARNTVVVRTLSCRGALSCFGDIFFSPSPSAFFFLWLLGINRVTLWCSDSALAGLLKVQARLLWLSALENWFEGCRLLDPSKWNTC